MSESTGLPLATSIGTLLAVFGIFVFAFIAWLLHKRRQRRDNGERLESPSPKPSVISIYSSKCAATIARWKKSLAKDGITLNAEKEPPVPDKSNFIFEGTQSRSSLRPRTWLEFAQSRLHSTPQVPTRVYNHDWRPANQRSSFFSGQVDQRETMDGYEVRATIQRDEFGSGPEWFRRHSESI